MKSIILSAVAALVGVQAFAAKTITVKCSNAVAGNQHVTVTAQLTHYISPTSGAPHVKGLVTVTLNSKTNKVQMDGMDLFTQYKRGIVLNPVQSDETHYSFTGLSLSNDSDTDSKSFIQPASGGPIPMKCTLTAK